MHQVSTNRDQIQNRPGTAHEIFDKTERFILTLKSRTIWVSLIGGRIRPYMYGPYSMDHTVWIIQYGTILYGSYKT